MAPFCPVCGTAYGADDVRFCPNCGRERPPEPLAAMPTAEAPAMRTPTEVTPALPTGPPPPPPVPGGPRTQARGGGFLDQMFDGRATPPGGVIPVGASGGATGPAHSRVFVWVVTLVLAVVVGGGATAGVLLWQNQGDTRSPAAAGGPSGGASAREPGTKVSPGTDNPARTEDSPRTEGSDRTGGSADTGTEAAPKASAPSVPAAPDAEGGQAVPDGYREVRDPMGFTFAVPEGWSRQKVERGSQVTYAAPTGFSHYLVGVIARANYTSYQNFRNLEEGVRKTKDDYRRVRLEANTFKGRDGALWEYTYTDARTGETVRVMDQGYVAENGTEYTIYLTQHDRDWQDGAVRTYNAALSSWRLDSDE
ncbi:zinc ribbon domain-containing protein [Streptomyces tsukubensis]|uniref:Zinc ribbon domain-containing protein n=1 Tax=Streptomyces tsukubensis TaxID=83656 RepID=A0A1V4A8P1_9ACTN|nr:zinc ribbon domain-containing protein [Streptomyces tsukubensis]OON78406.1 hypothetical protein B1H18_16620 [Streptomyces tsukubensis]QFR95167.1 hypothetical protein GBW32_21775 [Streptomyces tsukubensis]